MTKAELVEEVSRVSDLTKKHSEIIVETVFRSIIEALQRGEKIELRGFGSFRLRQREPRKGRNPKTGDKVDVPPKKVPYFKPGKELKELINQERAGSVPGARARRRGRAGDRADRPTPTCSGCREQAAGCRLWPAGGAGPEPGRACRLRPVACSLFYGTPLVSVETRLRDRHRGRPRLHLL